MDAYTFLARFSNWECHGDGQDGSQSDQGKFHFELNLEGWWKDIKMVEE